MDRQLVLFLIGLFFGLTVGWSVGREFLKDAAYKNGVGRYECDPETGEPRFVFGVKEKK